MNITIGRITSIIAALFLFGLVLVIGFIGANPDALINMGLPVGIALLVAAVLVALADYFYPTIQEVVETGARLQFTLAGILNILSGIIIVVLTVITTTPTLLEPILNENYTTFAVIVLPILLVVLKLFIHREPIYTEPMENEGIA